MLNYKKNLPLKEPFINVFPEHSHLMSIILNIDSADKWIYNNYVQLIYGTVKGFEYPYNPVFFPMDYYDTCPFIKCVRIKRNEISADNVISFICQSIDRGSIDDKQIYNMLASLDLEFLATHLNDLYGHEFGGIELSGGQKQRLAIIRATYRNGIIYAFDEPTSAIDPLQEKKIYEKLLESSNGKTTVIISHRLALTRLCDFVIVLKQGKIVEKGNHDELMKQNGEYATMWKSQVDLYLN